MPDFNWYIKRVRAMSAEEISHRVRMEVKKNNWRRLVKNNRTAQNYPVHWNRLSLKDVSFDLPKDSPEAAHLIEEANAYLEHRWFYGGGEIPSEPVIDWHADPASNIRAPLKFSFDINHRDEHLVGNIKITWEKSRHHHLTVLAAAYALTGDERYSKEVADQILDWINQNPYLVGVNWSHPLEQGIRLIAWVWCERLIRGCNDYEPVFGKSSKLWDSLYQHQEFIAETYSRGSSANNHLIGEMAGLFIAAVAFPIFDKSSEWQKLSQSVLEAEITKQTFPSGMNREMAFSYHIFALEFFLLAYLEGKSAGAAFSQQYTDYIKQMIEAMPLLTDYGRNLPRYGDGDEGMAIQLQERDERRDAWLYRVGRSVFNANVPIYEEGKLASSILGASANLTSDYQAPKGSTAFQDAGLYLLTSKRGTPDEIFVLADAGPHGYLSITAHAHADALAFTLSVGGKPILIDPGTFAYHTDEYWRQYFRGTRAHNTVMIDEADQSTQGGAFLWTSKAETTVHKWEVTPEGAELVASHNGYAGKEITHSRSLELQDNVLTCQDNIQGTGTHKITLLFHTAPECEIEQQPDGSLLITREDVKVHMQLPESFKPQLLKGEKSGGWDSPAFGKKQETYTITASSESTLPSILTTKVRIEQ